MPAYWPMKSESDELSIRNLRRLGTAHWDGVRSYQARDFIRNMNPGDLFFFYHSGCPQPGITGIARIEGEAYPNLTVLDPASPYHDPKASAEENPWSVRDVSFAGAFTEVVPLARLKTQDTLANLILVQKGSRFSVMPVSAEKWQAILPLAERRSHCSDHLRDGPAETPERAEEER